jgi:hypothetical protein
MTSRHIAIIGTAGRDKDKPRTKELWEAMLADARTRIGPDDFIHSGGAAWSDHIAVKLFLEGHIKHLSLWLPAPMAGDGRLISPQSGAKGSASASNYYHQLFSNVIGEDSMAQIAEAWIEGAWLNFEPSAAGYGGFFARNNKVAERAVDGCLAYTWGEGAEPADGGTKYTWDKCSGERIHIPLKTLL